jgi:hypothetical protein
LAEKERASRGDLDNVIAEQCHCERSEAISKGLLRRFTPCNDESTVIASEAFSRERQRGGKQSQLA